MSILTVPAPFCNKYFFGKINENIASEKADMEFNSFDHTIDFLSSGTLI